MVAKKKYPKSFQDDGLDDILECVDEILAGTENRLERNDDNKNSNGKKKDQKGNKKVKNESKKVKLYGDNEITNEKYKPPKRVKLELEEEEVYNEISTKKVVDENLDKRARGLINKLAAQTMPFVTSEFEKLYSTNSRELVDLAIFNNIESSIIRKEALAKRKLIAEFMLLVSYLNSKISSDIGASLVHRLVKKLEQFITIPGEIEDKRANNVICCITDLYIINLISSNVMYEISKRICHSESKVKSIELLLLILKNVSFQLRKENPRIIIQLISVINENNFKQSLETNSKLDFRVKHMLKDLDEVINAVKNNNINKINDYGCDVDKDTIETTLKNLIHKTKLTECLSDATYEEILVSPNWYLLETRLDEGEEVDKKKTNKMVHNFSSKKEVKVCKALGLNKPTERTIFGALLRSSDFNEATNNIIRFGVNHASDAMIVCIHVAIYEKTFNMFYFNLIHNLCKFNRKYKSETKFAIQDKIRTLGGMKTERVDIFKRLCFELIQSDAVPITILKAIEWADISTSTKDFLEYLLGNISKLPAEDRKKIMIKVDRKSSFAGAMRAFIECFMQECKLFH